MPEALSFWSDALPHAPPMHAKSGIQFFLQVALGPRFRGDERLVIPAAKPAASRWPASPARAQRLPAFQQQGRVSAVLLTPVRPSPRPAAALTRAACAG